MGNRRVYAVRSDVYRQAMALLIRTPSLLIAVDWSELKDDGRWHLLRAALVMRGCSITLYEEVYPQRQLNSAAAHKCFLKQLKALVPEGVCPDLITDAGFKVPWFRQVKKLEWHSLVRVRGQLHMSLDVDAPQWCAAKQWFGLAARRARKLGAVLLTMQKTLLVPSGLAQASAQRTGAEAPRWQKGDRRTRHQDGPIRPRAVAARVRQQSGRLSSTPDRALVRVSHAD